MSTARPVPAESSLPSLPLLAAEGGHTTLDAWRGRPLVVLCVRYYG